MDDIYIYILLKTKPNWCRKEGADKIIVQTEKKLKYLLANARSLTDKMWEFELIAAREQYDIIGITETWWDETHDWAVNLEGYSLFWKDRENRRGGGVCLYVKPDLKRIIREDVYGGNTFDKAPCA